MVEALGGDLSAAIALKKSAMSRDDINSVEAEIEEWKAKSQNVNLQRKDSHAE
jgi:hypothetical protein